MPGALIGKKITLMGSGVNGKKVREVGRRIGGQTVVGEIDARCDVMFTTQLLQFACYKCQIKTVEYQTK